MKHSFPKYIVAALCALIAVACYDSARLPHTDAQLPSATTTIAEVRRLCNGKSVDIETDVVVVGRVSTTDAEGNFSRSFFVEDSTGGIEIMAGSYDLYRKYPQGVQVALALNGCRVGFTDGAMQAGLRPEPYATYEVGYFMSDVLLDSHIQRSTERGKIAPTSIAIAALDPSWCGRLVRIEGVKYAPNPEQPTEPNDAQMVGYNRFTDSAGNAIYTFVGDDADFATKPLPTASLALCGIVLRGNVPNAGTCYIIKPRTSADYEVLDSHR